MFYLQWLSLLIFSSQALATRQEIKTKNFEQVYMNACNEGDKTLYIMIVYQSGFEIFSDQWTVKGPIAIEPNDCGKILITNWGSKIGKGYLMAKFWGKDFDIVTPKYKNRNSPQREKEPFNVIPYESHLCMPEGLPGEAYISEADLKGTCPGGKAKQEFNLWFNQASSVYEMTIYFREDGYSASYKSRTTEY